MNLNLNPIFVVGPARSGTTWVQCLICALDGFFSCPETHFFDLLISPDFPVGGYQLFRPRYEIINAYIDKSKFNVIKERLNCGFLKLDSEKFDYLQEKIEQDNLSYTQLFEYLILSSTLTQVDLRLRWVEKTPIHVSYLSQIFKLFPTARIVFVSRNPEDVILSAVRTFNIPASIAALDYWRSKHDLNEFILKNPEKIECIKIINYEKIINNRDEVLNLNQFLGIKYFDIEAQKIKARNLFDTIYSDTQIYNIQPKMVKSEIKDSISNSLYSKKIKNLAALIVHDYNSFSYFQNVIHILKKSLSLGILFDICWGIVYYLSWHIRSKIKFLIFSLDRMFHV